MSLCRAWRQAGASIDDSDTKDVAAAVALAQASDVAVLVVGDDLHTSSGTTQASMLLYCRYYSYTQLNALLPSNSLFFGLHRGERCPPAAPHARIICALEAGTKMVLYST